MRCLMCHKRFSSGSFSDVFLREDVLCEECRSQWKKIRYSFRFEGVETYASYLYNEAFAHCLIQYKECCDEALKDVFLFEEKHMLKKKYRGYTFVPMPSSPKRLSERGFSHTMRMLEQLQVPVKDLFEKTEDTDQKGKGRNQRTDMRQMIRLKDHVKNGEKYVLFDDTMTTGSTFAGAIGCLKDYECIVTVYTVSLNRRWLPEKAAVSLPFHM